MKINVLNSKKWKNISIHFDNSKYLHKEIQEGNIKVMILRMDTGRGIGWIKDGEGNFICLLNDVLLLKLWECIFKSLKN